MPSSSPIFPWASVWGGMWRGQASDQRVLMQQERQAVAELVRDGLLVIFLWKPVSGSLKLAS